MEAAMLTLGLVILLVLSALQALRSERTLVSALWLAATSAVLSILLYSMGAPEVAVIELSVGAGLVAVLFVFTFSLVGEHNRNERSSAMSLAGILVIVAAIVVLLGRTLTSMKAVGAPVVETGFFDTLWNARALDMLLGISIIFAGALGVLNLLSEGAEGHSRAHAAQAAEPVVTSAPKPSTGPAHEPEQPPQELEKEPV
jgi:uncharacterized MnhB-related membrane protein